MLKTLAIFFALSIVMHPTLTLAKAKGDTMGTPATQRCWLLFKGDSFVSETSVAIVGKENCKTKSEAEADQKENVQEKKETEKSQPKNELKEQEKTNQEASINDLVERVSELETQKPATSKQLQYGSGIQIPTAPPVAAKNIEQALPIKNVEVKAIPVKKEEIKAIEESISTIVQDVPPKKMNWWERIFSWFKK